MREGDLVVAASSIAIGIPKLVMGSTKTARPEKAFEPSHRLIAPFDPAMVLLQPVVQILVRPVLDL